REIQNDYNDAIRKDQNLIAWNHDFKGYEVVDSFLRNGIEFGGFILYNKNINDMVVVVPGTKSLRDWFKNVQVWGKKGNASTGAGVGLNIHKGFAVAYEQSIGSIKAAFNTFLEKNMDNIKSAKNPFTCHVTGHSLGAAIATILAYDFKTNLLPAKKIGADIKLVTVASPRLFDAKSGKKVEEKLGRGNMLRIFNVWDAVPTIVPEVYNSKHVGVDFPLYDSLIDEAYMGPMVVNHFMDRYTNIIEEGFDLLKKNLTERIRLEKAIDDFGQNYATAYNDFKNYVNDNDAHVKHVNQIKAEASDSDSDSESYDKIRKDKRGNAKAKKIEAAKIAKQDLNKAKNLKAEADRLEQDAMMASIMFEHAKNKDYSKNKQSEEELANFYQELGLDMDDLGEEQPTPDAIEAY
ncbi:MAG: lipase family protein, partial [Alphaproteobacteria bacterium]|nr:lipase family protein [Alphaproteobacteria bacterium]